jgi:transketolase
MSFETMKSKRLAEKVFLKLLEIKDSDLRLLTLFQGKTAVDKGIHIGGAFSALVPLTALYYGDIMQYDVEQPTRDGQDLFVLSKGHAVAALASVYADLGYFPESYLKNSRGHDSLLNGHPGPILPGLHTATGPLGQGICVAQGFALAARCGKAFDVFTLTGDGEMQEGVLWEAVMHAGAKHLDNFCVLVDKNEGQLDNPRNLLYPMNRVDEAYASFGWKVVSVDAGGYEPVLGALREFKYGKRCGRPTVIICNSRKGYGGFSSFMGGHKVDFTDAIADQEMLLQERRRETRVADLSAILALAEGKSDRDALVKFVAESAKKMNLVFSTAKNGTISVKAAKMKVKTKRAPKRDKKITFAPDKLPVLDPAKQYAAQDIVAGAMKVYAVDPRVMSGDADLASTSGLELGVGFVDSRRALNVGIAEANMMCVGESFAALGYNAWVSTFCPFFDWKVLRRIAVSHQERLEAIEAKNGWLAEGHGLDLTFLATAPNLETKTNGATHMGNDDSIVYDGIAHLQIIDVSCPQLLLSIIKWIMEGNRGLVYLRILRAGAPVLYAKDFRFEYGKGYYITKPEGAQVYIVSSGRGVYEALEAAKILEGKGIKAGVVDMPSAAPGMINELYDTGKKIVIAEQNNGYLWTHFRKVLFRRAELKTGNLIPVNLLDAKGNARFVHSATYSELLEHHGLAPKQIAERVVKG